MNRGPEGKERTLPLPIPETSGDLVKVGNLDIEWPKEFSLLEDPRFRLVLSHAALINASDIITRAGTLEQSGQKAIVWKAAASVLVQVGVDPQPVVGKILGEYKRAMRDDRRNYGSSRPDLLLAAAEVQLSAGDVEGAKKTIQMSEESVRRSNERERAAAILEQVGLEAPLPVYQHTYTQPVERKGSHWVLLAIEDKVKDALKVHRAEDALPLLQEAEKLLEDNNPDHTMAPLRVVSGYLAVGKLDDAIRILEQCEYEGFALDLWFGIASKHMEKGEVERAIQVIDNALGQSEISGNTSKSEPEEVPAKFSRMRLVTNQARLLTLRGLAKEENGERPMHDFTLSIERAFEIGNADMYERNVRAEVFSELALMQQSMSTSYVLMTAAHNDVRAILTDKTEKPESTRYQHAHSAKKLLGQLLKIGDMRISLILISEMAKNYYFKEHPEELLIARADYARKQAKNGFSLSDITTLSDTDRVTILQSEDPQVVVAREYFGVAAISTEHQATVDL